MALVLAALAALAAMTGCAAGRPSRPAMDPPGPPGAATAADPATVAAAEAVVAITVSSLRWDWYVSRAQQVLTAQCMRDHGFQYPLPAFGPRPSARTITAYSLGRGHPATYGVTPASMASSNPHDPGQSNPSYQYALGGPSALTATLMLPGGGRVRYGSGGCLGFGRRKLFGSVRAYMESAYLPQTVRSEFGQFLSNYLPYVHALHKWQSCMKAGGWKFPGPGAAIESVQALALRGMNPAGLARRQTEIAGTDAACDARSHLRASTRQALAAQARSLPSRILAQLSSIQSSRESALAVARRVLQP